MSFEFMNTEPNNGDRRSNRNLVTLSTFIESENSNGYVTAEKLKALVKTLETAYGFKQHYATFFDCVRDGHLIKGPVIKRTHRENQKDYIFLNLRRGRMNSEVTVYVFDNLEKFIRDYAEGTISIDFNLNDLIEFCNNH